MIKISNTIINDDIRKINFTDYSGCTDGLIGGPPCPPFSQTRHYLTKKQKGFDDKNAGFAVPEYFRALEEIKPKFFLFENVDGFMYKTHKKELEYFIKKSNELGYNLVFDVINTADYGIPQTRKRFFAIGFKNNLGTFSFPKATHSNPSKKKILGVWLWGEFFVF